MAKGVRLGGRAKGTPNKTQGQIREHFQKLIEENIETLSRDLKGLDPEQRIRLIIDLAKFVVPTLRATDLTTPNGSITITVESTDAQLGS